jgi:3-phosphoshikimate 1-carboxyvinyltransferase
MIEGLLKLGAKIKVIPQNNQENIIITGVKHLMGARVSSFGDHRTAMSLIIAGLKAKNNTQIDDVTCINKSFPTFLETLDRVIQ